MLTDIILKTYTRKAEAKKRALLQAAAKAMSEAAQNYGFNSPQYKAAKERHAHLCRELGY